MNGCKYFVRNGSQNYKLDQVTISSVFFAINYKKYYRKLIYRRLYYYYYIMSKRKFVIFILFNLERDNCNKVRVHSK